MDYDVIVVGAGISGLLSALAISKEGKTVLVLEKSDFIGGNARSYKVGKYTVDTGPHAITKIRDGPLKHLMDKYGNGLPEMVDHGDYYLRTHKGIVSVPASFFAWIKFDAITMKDRIQFFRLIMREVVGSAISGTKNGYNCSVYDSVKNINFSKDALKLIDSLCYLMSGEDMHATPVKRMLSGFSVEGIHGLSARDFIYTLKRVLISHKTSNGQSYPKGGLGIIIDSVVNNFPSDKVTIKTSVPVSKILIKNGKACGVKCLDKKYMSDCIVYTGFAKDLDTIVSEKLPSKLKENLSKIRQVKSYTLWLGVKGTLSGMDYKGSEIWYEDSVPCWAMPVSNVEPAVAPVGHQLVAFTFIITDTLSKTKKNAWELITKEFPDIEDKIDMRHEQVTIPEKAAITVNSFFPGNKSPFKHLYLAGTDTDPRSMGLTRAAHSVEEMLISMKKEGIIKD